MDVDRAAILEQDPGAIRLTWSMSAPTPRWSRIRASASGTADEIPSHTRFSMMSVLLPMKAAGIVRSQSGPSIRSWSASELPFRVGDRPGLDRAEAAQVREDGHPVELRVAGPGGDHGLALLVDPDAAERVRMLVAVGLGRLGDLLEVELLRASNSRSSSRVIGKSSMKIRAMGSAATWRTHASSDRRPNSLRRLDRTGDVGLEDGIPGGGRCRSGRWRCGHGRPGGCGIKHRVAHLDGARQQQEAGQQPRQRDESHEHDDDDGGLAHREHPLPRILRRCAREHGLQDAR